jgi:filamentous hemagglutinin family protein
MSTPRSHGRLGAVLAGGLLYAVSGVLFVTQAEVTSSGLGTVVNQPSAGVYDITGGTRPGGGTNLYHSFGDFSLDTGQSGNFLNDSGLPTTNILGRVTGGNPSNIFGTINTMDFPGANLFLVNPAGILFGPTAQLNVDGSFHATTADYIRFTDGTQFNAVPSAADALLTTAPPSAFGFLPTNPFTASIDVQAGTFDFSTGQFTNVFQVPTGQTLSFVSSTVNVGNPAGFPFGGFVRAPNGTLNLVSVASPGETTFNSPINVDGFAQLGDVNIIGGAIVDAGDVYIRSGQLAIEDATVWPGFFQGIAPTPTSDGSFAPALAGGLVDIDVSDTVSITRTGASLTPPGIQTFNGSAGGLVQGNAPDIVIKAGSLLIGSVDVRGGFIQTGRLGPGNASDVSITADTVEVRNGGNISLVNRFQGPGGALTIDATDVTLSSDGNSGFTGLAAQANFHPAYGQPGVPFLPFFQLADSGSITVNASGDVIVNGRAQITTDSFAFGRSNDITINAANVRLTGAGAETGVIAAQSRLSGPAGKVSINATDQIEVKGGFRVSANTFGASDGGVVELTADRSITLTGDQSRVLSGTLQLTDAEMDGWAHLYEPVIQFLGGPPIPDYATLRAVLGVEPRPGDVMDVLARLSTITVGGNPLVAVTDFTVGDAGAISIKTPVLTMNAGTRIETSTGWGDIVDPVTLETSGNAGDVIGNVGSLFLKDGGAIRSTSGIQRLTGESSIGLGEAGNIMITADDSIVLSGGSSISTEAALADGGNIKLTAPNIVQLTDSEITTSIFGQGAGNGGNINIDPETVVLTRSNIIANAFAGSGGNIQITANSFIKDASSAVEASSQFGVQGTIVLASPESDIAGSIAQLPQSVVDVSGLLPERCAARSAGGAQSSFVVAGRGGLPTNPDNYLPSFNAGSGPAKSGGLTTPGMSLSAVEYSNETTVAMAGWGCLQ